MMDSIPFEDSSGLQFWPPYKIASLRADFGGRIQAVHADGSVAHRPGPLPNDGPWRKSGDALVLPSLLSNGTDPAGFSYTQIPPLEDPLPEEQPLPIAERRGNCNTCCERSNSAFALLGLKKYTGVAEPAVENLAALIRSGVGLPTYLRSRFTLAGFPVKPT